MSRVQLQSVPSAVFIYSPPGSPCLLDGMGGGGGGSPSPSSPLSASPKSLYSGLESRRESAVLEDFIGAGSGGGGDAPYGSSGGGSEEGRVERGMSVDPETTVGVVGMGGGDGSGAGGGCGGGAPPLAAHSAALVAEEGGGEDGSLLPRLRISLPESPPPSTPQEESPLFPPLRIRAPSLPLPVSTSQSPAFPPNRGGGSPPSPYVQDPHLQIKRMEESLRRKEVIAAAFQAYHSSGGESLETVATGATASGGGAAASGCPFGFNRQVR